MTTGHKIGIAFAIIVVVALLAYLGSRPSTQEAFRERLDMTFTDTPSPMASVSEPPVTPSVSPTVGPAAESSSIIVAINAEREEAGVSALARNPILTALAQSHADDMARRGFFSHTNPGGVTFEQRIAASGYAGTADAENLALTSYDAVTVVAGWMDSPAHRANLLGSQYVAVGIGVSGGIWQGVPVTFVVAVFGNVQ